MNLTKSEAVVQTPGTIRRGPSLEGHALPWGWHCLAVVSGADVFVIYYFALKFTIICLNPPIILLGLGKLDKIIGRGGGGSYDSIPALDEM